MTMIRHISLLTALFFGSLALFLWGLSAQEIIGFDSRFYLFALEMGRHGISWFPTTYHQPYPDYPATGTLAVYGLAMLFGGINKLIAVLPTAIMAAITLCLVYSIGALQSKRWGFAAVCLLLLSAAFLKSARTMSLDMATTMVTTACFYLLCLADLKQRNIFIICIYPCLSMGFAFRGPIGLIVPTAVVCSYYLLNLRIKKCLLTGSIAFCLLVGAMFALILMAYQAGGLPFVQEMLRMQIWGRIDHNYLPFYFYFTSSFIDYAPCYPLAVLMLLIAGASALMRRQQAVRIPNLLALCGWMGVILIGMSIPGDKKVRYILPMLPAAALIAAYPFSLTKIPLFTGLRTLLLRIFLLLPLILEVAILGLYVKQPPLEITVPYASTLLVLAFFIKS